MNLLITEIVSCLLAALLLGLVAGWLVHAGIAARQRNRLAEQHRAALHEQALRHENDMGDLEEQLLNLREELNQRKDEIQNLRSQVREQDDALHDVGNASLREAEGLASESEPSAAPVPEANAPDISAFTPSVAAVALSGSTLASDAGEHNIANQKLQQLLRRRQADDELLARSRARENVETADFESELQESDPALTAAADDSSPELADPIGAPGEAALPQAEPTPTASPVVDEEDTADTFEATIQLSPLNSPPMSLSGRGG